MSIEWLPSTTAEYTLNNWRDILRPICCICSWVIACSVCASRKKVFGGNSKMLLGASFFDNSATYQVCLKEMVVLASVS